MTVKKLIETLHKIECHILDAESDLDKARFTTKILRMDLEDAKEKGMTTKDTIKAIKRVSRENHKLPKAKIISPNKKEYKRKPKKKEVYTPELHIGWPDWWMD